MAPRMAQAAWARAATARGLARAFDLGYVFSPLRRAQPHRPHDHRFRRSDAMLAALAQTRQAGTAAYATLRAEAAQHGVVPQRHNTPEEQP